MVGESWNVFTKRVLVAKHIRDSMYENSGREARLPLPSSADVHGYILEMKRIWAKRIVAVA